MTNTNIRELKDMEKSVKEVKRYNKVREEVNEEDSGEDSREEVYIEDDERYQILSTMFETTEGGKNIADILNKLQKDIHNIADNSYKLQKDIHLLATSVSKLIELSIKSQTES